MDRTIINKKSTRNGCRRIRFSLVIEFLNAKRWTLYPTINGVKANHHRRNENRGRNNRATVANCRLHQLTHRLPLTVVSSGLLNVDANIDDANVHVVEENFSFRLNSAIGNGIIKIIQTLWNERKTEWEGEKIVDNGITLLDRRGVSKNCGKNEQRTLDREARLSANRARGKRV